MRALVTGGAGYIGSHVARVLSEAGWEVVILDNFEKGHRGAVGDLPALEGDIRDRSFLSEAFGGNSFDAVLHFAAYTEVGQSVSDPLSYWQNNLCGGLNVIEAAVRSGVKRFVFSSTAAVYGTPQEVPVTEEAPTAPINPYGQSKHCVELALEDCCKAYGLSYAALRYFNAAGTHPDGTIGEDHRPESHLIPNILERVARGEEVSVFGTDYPTPDGTCVRDYVHVMDLAEAHRLALDAMEGRAGSGEIFNLGNGEGTSVAEIIAEAESVTGKKVLVKNAPRRPGDPPVLVASSAKAERILGWKPEYADVGTIIATAWRWHESHPEGYGREE